MAIQGWDSTNKKRQARGSSSADGCAPASETWSLDRVTTASTFKICHLLFLRHRSGTSSRLLLATTDIGKAREVEALALGALQTLSSDAFIRFFALDNIGKELEMPSSASPLTH